MLSLDVFNHTLCQLAPARTPDHVAMNVLMSFRQTSSLLREAASVLTIWEPHYKAKYIHCVQDRELKRQESYRDDYTLMYFERRRMDIVAVQIID
jgi:F-box protein 21